MKLDVSKYMKATYIVGATQEKAEELAIYSLAKRGLKGQLNNDESELYELYGVSHESLFNEAGDSIFCEAHDC